MFPDESSQEAFYSSLGLIALHLQLSTPDQVLEMLIHEATHAFEDRHLTRPGVHFPSWLQEGLAEYMSNSRIKKGVLIPGRVPSSRQFYTRFVEAQLVVTRAIPQARLSMVEMKSAMKSGEALTLAEVLDSDIGSFEGARLQFYYSLSWLVVHFLRHGEDSWTQGAFPDFLLYAAEGFPIVAAIESAYGRPVAALEEPFREYVIDF